MFAPILIENPEINVYDIRKKCVGPLCYDFSRMVRAGPAVLSLLPLCGRAWGAGGLLVLPGAQVMAWNLAECWL